MNCAVYKRIGHLYVIVVVVLLAMDRTYPWVGLMAGIDIGVGL